MGALQLLRGERYEINPGEEYGGSAMPPQPGLTIPTVSEGPPAGGGMSPAEALAMRGGGAEPMPGAMPEAMPMDRESGPDPSMVHSVAARPDQMMGQPTKPRAGGPDWMTPERRAMYEKTKRAAQNYRKAVDSRRMRRKQAREYSKLYNDLNRHVGAMEDLENLQKTYPELYPPDDPRTLALVREQAKRFEQAERAKNELRSRLQKYGVKIGPKDPLPEDPWGGDDGDEQFDRFIQSGFMDALTTPY